MCRMSPVGATVVSRKGRSAVQVDPVEVIWKEPDATLEPLVKLTVHAPGRSATGVPATFSETHAQPDPEKGNEPRFCASMPP